MAGRLIPFAILTTLCQLTPASGDGLSSRRLVSSSKELGAALTDEAVTHVVIRRTIRIAKDDWVLGGTAIVGSNRHVIIESEKEEYASAVLDLGSLVDAIHVAGGSHLTLLRLSVPNSASRQQPRPSSRVQLRVEGTFALWPSITLARGSSMTFEESTFYYWSDKKWDNCDKFRQVAEGLLNPKNISGMLQWSASDNEVFILGSQNMKQNLFNIVTGEVFEHAFRATRANHTLVCLPDPFKQEADSTTPWYMIIVAMFSVIAAIGVKHFLGAIKLRGALVQTPMGSPHSTAGSGSHSGGTKVASVEMLSSLLRDRQRASVGGLELGPLLGRGSFGKVYKGVWRGALVAVKIVSHDCSLASLAETLRESALSTSIHHPHVVTTFKVRTIRLQPGGSPTMETAWSEGQDGSLDEACGDGLRLYNKAMSQSHQSDQQTTSPKEASMTAQPLSGETLEQMHAGSPSSTQEMSPTGAETRPSFFGHVMSRLKSLQMRPTRLGPLSPPHMPSVLQESSKSGLRGHLSAAARNQDAVSEGAELLETWIILEFCDQGNFSHAIRHGRFADNLPSGVLCLVDIASGMAHLHSLGILHGDLKGANVMLKTSAASDHDQRGFRCKLADFGLSRILESNRTHVSTTTYGTAAYMPRELLLEGRLSKATDMYSFAMLMHELVTGKQLFENTAQSQIICKVITGWRPTIPLGVDKTYVEIMEQCWHRDPAQRPTFSELLPRLRSLYISVRNQQRARQ